MKSWLTKFKISNALNERKPMPPAVAQAIARSVELRRFVENSNALDHALKVRLPKSGASAPVHASIMRAVRAAGHAPVAETQSLWPRWIPVSVPILLVLLGGFLAIEFFQNPNNRIQPGNSHGLAAASSALELGGNLVREAPAIALAPLSEEMQRLDRDLVNTKEFLLACLP